MGKAMYRTVLALVHERMNALMGNPALPPDERPGLTLVIQLVDLALEGKEDEKLALMFTHRRLMRYLHEVPLFPNSERHETAVTLDLVTRALDLG